MPALLQQALERAAADAPAWLAEHQGPARAYWEQSPLPTRRTEAWKYTSLSALECDFRPASALEAERLPALRELLLPLADTPRLVFVNGHFTAELSSLSALPEGLSVCRFAEAEPAQAERIRKHLGSVVASERHLFASLNSAALSDGVLVEVAASASVEQPLQVVWLSAGPGSAAIEAGAAESDAAQPFTLNQRVLVHCARNSCLSLIEHHASLDDGQCSFSNGVSELLLEDGATLHHYRLQLETGGAMHIGGVHARLQRDATLNSFHLGLGSDLKRIDLSVEHAGPGAHAELSGLYLPRGDEHIDYHTTIEHAVPHCTSSEVFRGVMADRSSAVFNGRIHIHPQAQKTRAELSNRNLLTSTEAQINTKPELEIYADDVQCAHGATVAQLDALSMHYLRSRGVSRAEAEVMLSFGFVNEVLDGVRHVPLRDHLRPLLASRFARDPALMRHLT
jgi:Fe-S cluster assembly protein SufD